MKMQKNRWLINETYEGLIDQQAILLREVNSLFESNYVDSKYNNKRIITSKLRIKLKFTI